MMTATDLLAGRVLAFTEAEAILGDVTAAVDLLRESLTTHVSDHDETIGNLMALMLKRARDQWLDRNGGAMAAEDYQRHRAAVIGRARTLERRALAAAAAAARLAEKFEGAEHYDTVDDLTGYIDTAATRLAQGGYSAPHEAFDAMVDLWARIKGAPLLPYADADLVRRHFDTALDTRPHPALAAEVDTWRESHLKGAAWDADTWAYAVDTCRTWDEARTLWDGLADPATRGPLTPAQAIRLRTRIAVKVTAHLDAVAEHVPTLVDDVAEFEHSPTAISARIRIAETFDDLAVIVTGLEARDLVADGTINLMRAAARKFDTLESTDPEAVETGALAGHLHNRVNAFRHHLYTTALACTSGRGAVDYTEEQRYTLVYNALADAVHTGWAEHVDDLMTKVERVAAANAGHIISPDHIARLRAVTAAQPDTEPITVNGGTR